MTASTKLGGLGRRKRPGDARGFKPMFMEFIRDDSREMGRGYFERGNMKCAHLKKQHRPWKRSL